jgi:hypothetical protein
MRGEVERQGMMLTLVQPEQRIAEAGPDADVDQTHKTGAFTISSATC